MSRKSRPGGGCQGSNPSTFQRFSILTSQRRDEGIHPAGQSRRQKQRSPQGPRQPSEDALRISSVKRYTDPMITFLPLSQAWKQKWQAHQVSATDQHEIYSAKNREVLRGMHWIGQWGRGRGGLLAFLWVRPWRAGRTHM